MSLIEKLKAGKRNIKIIKFPGTDEDIGIAVLTVAETQEAVFAAERVFKENGIEVSAATVGVYGSENNTQVLFRALVDPRRKKPDETYERYFKNVDELRGLLRREAKDLLIDEYNAFEEDSSPSPLSLSEEEFESIIEDIKKNQTIGSDTNFRTLKGLTIYLVNQLSTLQKDSGSISSP